MFARKVSIPLKPNTLAEFASTFEKEIVPLLRKQQGFKDEVTFAAPGSTEVLAFSLWDTKKDADLYDSTSYKDVLKMLANVIDGTPKVETTELLHSTFHEIRTAKPVAA
jgi:heme-degrading monooxygenase HmoA